MLRWNVALAQDGVRTDLIDHEQINEHHRYEPSIGGLKQGLCVSETIAPTIWADRAFDICPPTYVDI
jgi:hypothetical protein